MGIITENNKVYISNKKGESVELTHEEYERLCDLIKNPPPEVKIKNPIKQWSPSEPK